MAAGGINKITQGIDHNTFKRVNVNYDSFDTLSDVVFKYRHRNLSFSMVFEGTGTIQYSFNGNTVHGDMQSGTATASIFFDNRNVSGIWFRRSAGDGGNVRVEGWANP